MRNVGRSRPYPPVMPAAHPPRIHPRRPSRPRRRSHRDLAGPIALLLVLAPIVHAAVSPPHS